MDMVLDQFLQDCLLYQDQDILVVNKPAGLLSIPGKGSDLADSLLTRLQRIQPKTLLIHRLDRDTSGILVFALNKAAQSHISKQFQQRQTHKVYQAIVAGHIAAQGQVGIPVRYDETRPPLHIADPDYPKPALTYFTALQHTTWDDYAVSRVALTPITGRSHQLRVHMQYLGHPIIGDTLYADARQQALFPRLCLHAAELTLSHPATGKSLKLTCPPPF